MIQCSQKCSCTVLQVDTTPSLKAKGLMLQHVYRSLPVVVVQTLPSDTLRCCVPAVFSRLQPGFASLIYSTSSYPVGGGIQDPSQVLCLLAWIFVFKNCNLCDQEPMRYVKDHKEELRSHTSTHVGPAAPVTCVSGPFSSCQAACTSQSCEISSFPAWFASLRLCFIAVKAELPLLNNV